MITRIVAGIVIAALGILPAVAQETKPPALPAVGAVAPDFTLKEAQTGKKRRLQEFAKAKRPVALFFFCGCSWCADTAREWAVYQRTHALPMNAATVIVYQTSDATEARNLLTTSGLDPKQTALLLDGDRAVTDNLYHSDPCPRIVIVDPGGKVRYVNTGADEKPREAPPQLLAARALAMLGSGTMKIPTPGK